MISKYLEPKMRRTMSSDTASTFFKNVKSIEDYKAEIFTLNAKKSILSANSLVTAVTISMTMIMTV